VNREQVERAEAHLIKLAAVAAVVDPVPAADLEAAIVALDFRSMDAELARLVFDSALDDLELAGVRSTGNSRQLTFEATDLVVELEVDVHADSPLVGQLVPPGSAEIEIRSLGTSVMVEADERGRFWAPRLPGRLVSLHIKRRHDARAEGIATPWVSLQPSSAYD
jgi:hypothetical protein